MSADVSVEEGLNSRHRGIRVVEMVVSYRGGIAICGPDGEEGLFVRVGSDDKLHLEFDPQRVVEIKKTQI